MNLNFFVKLDKIQELKQLDLNNIKTMYSDVTSVKTN